MKEDFCRKDSSPPNRLCDLIRQLFHDNYIMSHDDGKRANNEEEVELLENVIGEAVEIENTLEKIIDIAGMNCPLCITM